MQNSEIQNVVYTCGNVAGRFLKIQVVNKNNTKENNIKIIKINDIYCNIDEDRFLVVTLKINGTEKKITFNNCCKNFPMRNRDPQQFRENLDGYLTNNKEDFKQILIEQIKQQIDSKKLDNALQQQKHEELQQEDRYIARAIRECLNKVDCCDCLLLDHNSPNYGYNSPYLCY